MAGSDLLNVGLTGLLAYQRALATTAHNIANVNTPGYSRQTAELATLPAHYTGQGQMGAGVTVTDIRRTYDEFLTRQLQVDTALAGQLNTEYELSADLDNLLGDSSTGLTVALQELFNAFDTVADDPSSTQARQLLLGQAGTLADRFHSLDARLTDMAASVRTRLQDTVSDINGLAESIAKLNRDIVSGGAVRGQPNDLLDARDELVRQLAERVSVTTVAQGDGALNVFVGTGQSLVMGGRSQSLAVAPRAEDPTRSEILLVGPGGGVPITGGLSGGRLGGLLAFESGSLAEARGSLGTLALGLAEAVNDQHALGMDLDGAIGGLFFGDINSPTLQDARALANASNTGTAQLTVTVDDVAALGADDYRLFFDGTQYSLLRQADGAVVGTYASLPQSVEGFTINLAAGPPALGDSFLIRPTAGAARQFSVAVADLRSIALAAPIRTASVPGNLGDGQIGVGRVGGLAGTPLSAPVTLTYDAAAGLLNVSAPPGGTLAYDPATDSGSELTLSVPGFGDVMFTLSGRPSDGDRFTITGNSGGTGDNRNALLLSRLQDARILSDGSATLAEGYGRLVADVGVQTRTLEIKSTSQSQVLSTTREARDQGAGVNLDEEAANLLRYQQAYQASAQAVAASRELFQILLGVFS